MKIETAPEEFRLDTQRRRLLLGLPAGLALASPLALIACGGGGDSGSDSSGSGVDLHDAGRAFVGDGTIASVAVAVALPMGVTVPGGALAAHTMIGGFGVVGSGTTMLPLAFGGVQLATVYTADGLPIVLGWVDATMTTIDTHSTATALLASALGAPMFDADLGKQWIVEIGASPAAAAFGDAIAAALATDLYAVATFSPAISAALQTAVRALLSASGKTMTMAGRMRPLGVTINPAVAASGVEPVLAETVNTVYVQNEKLRRAYYVIRRESSVNAAGDTVKDAARTVVASGDIPMLPAFSSAGGIITAVTTAVYADDQSGLAFSKTPETTLTLEPADAKSTTYSVAVLMAGNEMLGFDSAAASQALSLAELQKIDIQQFSTSHLGLQTLLLDLLVPMAIGWIGGKISGAGTDLGPREFKEKLQIALLGQLVGVLTTTIPSVVAKLQDFKNYPDYGIGGALSDIVTNHLVVFVDVPVPGRATPVTLPALSKFSIGLLTLLLKFIAYEKLNAVDGEKLLVFLEGTGDKDKVDTRYTWVTGSSKGKETRVDFDITNLEHAGIGVAMKALATVDAGLSWLNDCRIAVDVGTSRLYETWDLKVVKPNIKLTPSPLKVDKLGVSVPIKAEIVDNDNDEYGNEKGSFRFDWVCTGQYGDLFKPDTGGGGTPESNHFSTSNANATCNYMARTLADADATPETITVQAWFEPIGASKPAVLLGSAKATVEFKQEFSLAISPKSGDFPTGITMPVLGYFNENVPSNASVEWEWTHAGAGTLTTPPTDGNLKQHAVDLATGDVDGNVTLSVKATIRIPGTSTTAGRTVITKAVSASYRVLKGTRTLSFECSGGIFACGPTCGVTDYTAYIVPKIQGALSYSAKLSGFAYPSCNRTVTWTAAKGDGGDCDFPITDHPFSTGPAARNWAVWIGFGGPLAEGNKCVATITVPA